MDCYLSTQVAVAAAVSYFLAFRPTSVPKNPSLPIYSARVTQSRALMLTIPSELVVQQ